MLRVMKQTSRPQVEKHGGMPMDGVLVNGDSGNDVELFAVPGVRGTMVANAHPELREWCEAHASNRIFPVRACFLPDPDGTTALGEGS